MLYEYRPKSPKIDSTVFIAPGAMIIGEVEIEAYSSVWFNTVIRGDVHYIKIGQKTNIQDGSILHVTHDTFPLFLQDEVTVGHGVILHGCRIRSRVLIGMGTVVLDGAVIGEDSIIGAGSLVTEGTELPSGWLSLGSPARPKRKLTDKERTKIIESANNYVSYSERYKQHRRDSLRTAPILRGGEN